jgi:hypothetical protein
MRSTPWSLIVLAICASACSEECVLEACDDALQPQPKGSIEQGIVGVVAYRTDACANDCCECNYSMGTLKIFGVDAAVRDAADALTLNLQVIYGPALMRVFDAESVRRKELVVGDGAPY